MPLDRGRQGRLTRPTWGRTETTLLGPTREGIALPSTIPGIAAIAAAASGIEGVVRVKRRVGVGLLRRRERTSGGGEDDREGDRGLGEHGRVSCLRCHAHRLGVCSHLVRGDARGKSAGRPAESIPAKAGRMRKSLVAAHLWSTRRHPERRFFGLGTEVFSGCKKKCGRLRGESRPRAIPVWGRGGVGT